METSELKNMLIARIRQIDDVAFLKAIKTITDAQAENSAQPNTLKQKTGWHTASTSANKPERASLHWANDGYFDQMEQFLQDT